MLKWYRYRWNCSLRQVRGRPVPFNLLPIHGSLVSRSSVALLCIVGLGFLIQIVGIEEDGGTYIHPDEPHAMMSQVASARAPSSLMTGGPATPTSYKLLESGDFRPGPIAAFTSALPPVGWSHADQDGEESYLNFSDAAVAVYEKSELAAFGSVAQLNWSAAVTQSQPVQTPEPEPLTFDEPVSELPVVDDARWSESLTGSSWSAAAVWILMLVLPQAAALPVSRTVFRAFPDRGWGYTRLIGIILPATVLWWLSSAGLVHFEARWVVVSMALFALAAWLWLPSSVTLDFRHHFTSRLFLSAEIVFWLTFGLFLVFRMINPDSWHPIWGGEKPMEFAHINAILRSATFPPVDPWYSGGYINYYYYGLYLVAYLIKLTGIPIEFAFNLAQPTFIALLASGVFSTGATIGGKLSRGKAHPFWSGIIADLLVSFAGNMRAAAQVFQRLRDDSEPIDGFSYWVFAPSRAIDFAITEFPYFTALYADLHPHVVAFPITVLCIGLGAAFAFEGEKKCTSMSRHSVAWIVVAGFALGILYPTNAWDLPVYAALVIVSVAVGTTMVGDGWRRLRAFLGTITLVAVIAVAIALPFLWHYEAQFGSIDTVRSTTSVLEFILHMGGPMLILTASVPMLMTMAGRGKSLLPTAATFLVLTSILLLWWVFVQLQSGLVPYMDDLIVIVVSAIWLATLYDIARACRPLDLGLPRLTLTVIALLGASATVMSILAGREVLGLYLAIGLSVSGVWLLARNVGLRFLAALVAAACFVGAGLEVVYLVDDLASGPFYRMNTVFKFYNQIWILIGVAGGSTIGALLPLLVSKYFRGSAQAEDSGHRSSHGLLSRHEARHHEWGAVALVAHVLVLVFSAAYPVTATGIRLATRFPDRDGGLTLNAYAWMDYGTVELADGTVVRFDEDRDVIHWFNHEVSGTPVIAEASFGPYRCNSSRISIGTGLPAVLGWQRHEAQQRSPDVLPQRERDLRALYGSGDVDLKRGIIAKYDIKYIVVGELERNYPVIDGNACVPMDQTEAFDHFDLDQGIAAFETMEGAALEVAFQSGSTTVYRVVGNS